MEINSFRKYNIFKIGNGEKGMETLKNLLKNILKMMAVYIAFGFLLGLAASAGGLAKALLVDKTLGAMSIVDYMMLFGWFEFLWLPLLVSFIFSKHTYLTIPNYRLLLTAIVVAFIFVCRIVLKKE